jgi:ribosomal-protein-alanine N-acetyltransferase
MIPEDLDQVSAIEISDPLAPWSKKMFLEEMQQALAHCFVVKRKDGLKHSVVGFICFRNVTEESELLKICVHPDYRRLGIGRKLMQFYIDFSRRMGVQTFHLEVNASNQPAVHLYRSLSYQPSGMRKKFYQEKFDALLMMKKLRVA